MHIMSQSLIRTVPVNAILLADKMVFPGIPKREDTFSGGLSMGGFGALDSGLKHSDTFIFFCW